MKLTMPKLEIKKAKEPHESKAEGAVEKKTSLLSKRILNPAKEGKAVKEEKVKTPKVKKEKPAKEPKNASKRGGGKETRYVFMLGDEGAILLFMRGKTVIKRLFATNTDPENIQNFRQVLSNSPKASVYALVDMMDQSYLKQSLPPVTKFSVQKLIKRRLERDFGPEDITGALPIGRESSERKDWNFMLISLAGTPQLMQWIDFILEFPNPFEGLYLVPIESAILMKELARLHFGKEAKPWQLLVCHHKVGGFRQIILKDGKLAFTRLAQAASNTSPEVIAGSIEQEVSNTIEYLKRLSYNEEQGLDCFMIVSSEIKQHIDVQKIKANNTRLLTPFEAAEMLGLSGAALPEDHYADIVVSAYFGQLKKKILPLHNRISGQLVKFRKLSKNSIIAGALITLIFGGYAAYATLEVMPKSDELETIKSQIRGIQAATEEANSKVSSLGAGIDKADDIISLDTIFSRKDNEVFVEFVKTFRQAAQEDVIVKKIGFIENRKIEDVFNKLPANVVITAEVEFVNSTGSVDSFARKAKNFFERMRNAFPQYRFNNSRLPGIIDQDEAFKAEFSKNSDAKSQGQMSGEPIVVTLTFMTPPPEQPAAPY